MPQGIAYANWEFDVPWLENLEFDIEIVSGDEQKPGRFVQLQDYRIGVTPSYCGFQTDLKHPQDGWQGKGLLFTRWETQDLQNADSQPNGFTEVGQHEDLFVGVRNRWKWTLGRYRCCLRQSKPDDAIGRWYELHVRRVSDGEESTSGSLRFPNVDGKPPLIQSGGGTWLEVYGDIRHAMYDEEVPRTEVIIHEVWANDGTLKPERVRLNYNDAFPAANTVLGIDGLVTLVGGKGVISSTPAGTYPLA